MRILAILVIFILLSSNIDGRTIPPVVADSINHMPLSHASVFNKNDKFIGTSDSKGEISCASEYDYPITIRFMGYEERIIPNNNVDTLFLQAITTQLPEFVLESRKKRMLYILAYVREYSTLTSFSDTITMFREKLVDFMLNEDYTKRSPCWMTPRILNSKSYYHFSNEKGLDSVSDKCNHHFTWSDWIGILPPRAVPDNLIKKEFASDTLSGKYSPVEIWHKNEDRISVDVNILADQASRKWVPELSAFFNDNIEFDKFHLRLNYNNVIGDSVTPLDLTRYSFNIESEGRGHSMFRFNRRDEPFYVTTYSEAYILDKNYISIKEAKRCRKNKPTGEDVIILPSPDAPPLKPSILELIARVGSIDEKQIRLSSPPDRMLIGKKRRRSFTQNALMVLKQSIGLDQINGIRKQNNNYKDFRKEQIKRNHSRSHEQE